MNNLLVSIIIPVYNAKEFIGECIESVMSQTYKNIEIIIVDDGSKDGTKEVLSAYIVLDKRIKYIYKRNEGVSKARNRGIQESRGEYIIFVDADDYVDELLVEKAVDTINEQKSDGCFFEYYYKTQEGQVSVCDKVIEYGYYPRENLLEIIGNMCGGGLYYSSVWRGIYKSTVIKNNEIEFRNLKFAEDLLFNIEYILNCSNIFVSDKAFYYYCEQESSAVKKIQNEIEHTLVGMKENNHIFLKYRNRGLDSIYLNQVKASCFRILNMTLKYKLFRENIKKMEIVKGVVGVDKTYEYIIKNKYLQLYILLWIKKVKKKLQSTF